MSYPKSLVAGSTAAARRVIADAVAANGVPTTSADALNIFQFRSIDVVAKCTGGGGSYDFLVWWYYGVADEWVYDTWVGTTSISTAGGVEGFPIALGSIFSREADGVYLEVKNFAGGGSADLWLIGRE